jgi:hypothetical protein
MNDVVEQITTRIVNSMRRVNVATTDLRELPVLDPDIPELMKGIQTEFVKSDAYIDVLWLIPGNSEVAQRARILTNAVWNVRYL